MTTFTGIRADLVDVKQYCKTKRHCWPWTFPLDRGMACQANHMWGRQKCTGIIYHAAHRKVGSHEEPQRLKRPAQEDVEHRPIDQPAIQTELTVLTKRPDGMMSLFSSMSDLASMSGIAQKHSMSASGTK